MRVDDTPGGRDDGSLERRGVLASRVCADAWHSAPIRCGALRASYCRRWVQVSTPPSTRSPTAQGPSHETPRPLR